MEIISVYNLYASCENMSIYSAITAFLCLEVTEVNNTRHFIWMYMGGSWYNEIIFV